MARIVFSFRLLICLSFFLTMRGVVAQNSDELPQFFFDAKSTYFTRDGKKQVFEGEVIALGSKVVVTADTVIIDQEKGLIEAKGHVVLIADTQVFTGEKVEYHLKTGDFKLGNAVMILNDPAASKKVRDRILGLSEAEIEFEAKRGEQLNAIKANKVKLQNRARALIKQGKEVPDAIIREYALEIEREQLISDQKSPTLSKMKEEKRANMLRRRQYWDDARGKKLVSSPVTSAIYFKVVGESIERTNQNDFSARNSIWTPCFCDDDETPAWAFRSSSTFAQVGGYATFYNPILEIKGIPVLYLPYLKVPVKDQRQSGFLMPVLTSESESGTIYSQPLFLDLGKNMDATVRTDTYEKRGTRLGTEFRYKNRKNSGFTLNVEAIRDRLWLEKKTFREDYKNAYREGLIAARGDTSGNGPDQIQNLSGREYHLARLRQRSYWEEVNASCVNGSPAEQLACEEQIEKTLGAPSNVTRGLVKWSGNEFFTDRISLVSTGEGVSDRFYNVDLYLSDGEAGLFASKRAESPFNRIDNRIHFDYPYYYLGLGSQFGDSATNNDPYEGQQLPYNFRGLSTMYLLTPKSFDLLPIYAQVGGQSYRILEVEGPTKDPNADKFENRSIGSGHWRRAEAHFVAPLFHRTALSVDHFTDLEARSIEIDRAEKPYSSVSSWKTGFRFRLPIDGKMKLSSTTDESGEESTRFLQHVMSWDAILSLRPSVDKNGVYPEEAGTFANSTYFATDTEGSDGAFERTAYMQPYQIIELSTTHEWKLFTRSWSTLLGVEKKKEDIQNGTVTKETSEDRARRELMRSMDRSVKSFSDILGQDRSKWFVDRYQLLDNDYQVPVTFGAGISYDYLMAQQRAKLGDSEDDKKRREQLRPWSPLETATSLNWAGWTLSNTIQHNIYLRRNTAVKFSLGLPSFYQTNVSYSYTISLETYKDETTKEYTYQPTTTREVNVATSLMSPMTAIYKYGRKLVDKPNQSNREEYMQGLGLVYNSPSKCWNLTFGREKGYGAEERDASYRLELGVIFMGATRNLPSMHEPVLREVRNYDEES